GGSLRTFTRTVLSCREHAGLGWIRARDISVAWAKRSSQAVADNPDARVHLHAARLRPPQRRRCRCTCATRGRELLVQPQAARCSVRNAALVLCNRRGEGCSAG